jgi:hypothetical protein
MIRRSPAEKYIEYLLTHPDGYSDDAVIELLRLKQLDFLGPQYLDRLRKNLRPPAKFVPDNRFHKPSARFLAANRLYYLYHPDKHTQDAFRILEDPRGKEAMETLLIARDSPRLCAYRLEPLGLKVAPTAVDRYKYFFFNVDLVDSTELAALMHYRREFAPERSDKYEDQMRASIKKVSYNDPRKTLTATTVPDIARMMNKIRMGYLPKEADVSQLLKLTQTVALLRSFGVASGGHGQMSAGEARDWMMVAKMAHEIQMDVGRPDADMQRELQALLLKTEDSALPHITELSGGEHTADLHPLELTDGERVYDA